MVSKAHCNIISCMPFGHHLDLTLGFSSPPALTPIALRAEFTACQTGRAKRVSAAEDGRLKTEEDDQSDLYGKTKSCTLGYSYQKKL